MTFNMKITLGLEIKLEINLFTKLENFKHIALIKFCYCVPFLGYILSHPLSLSLSLSLPSSQQELKYVVAR